MPHVPDHFYALSHMKYLVFAEQGLHLEIPNLKECLKVIKCNYILFNTVKCTQV